MNMWFEADKPVIDFLKAESASCNAVGWTMLQAALVQMENFWRTTQLITRNPNLAFIFKKPGVRWDMNGLSFFFVDLYDYDEKFVNSEQNIFSPRNSDEK